MVTITVVVLSGLKVAEIKGLPSWGGSVLDAKGFFVRSLINSLTPFKALIVPFGFPLAGQIKIRKVFCDFMFWGISLNKL